MKPKKQISKLKSQSPGFTLLEMIVSLAIFAVAALLATSSLLSLTDAQKKAFALQSAYDNLRFSLETIAKDARTGDSYYCGDNVDDLPGVPTQRDCPSGGPALTYRNANGDIIAYRAFNGQIEKFTDDNLSGFLTSTDIVIDNLTFYVLGGPSGVHPRITIVIKGHAGQGRTVSEFNLQTSISQRRVNP